MKNLLMILAGIGGIALIAYFIRAGQEERASSVNRFEPVTLAHESLAWWVEATGEVRPRNRLQVRPPLGGRVEEMLVEEGEQVVQGQVLAWISSTERAVLLDAARAQGAERLEQWMDVYRPTALVAPLDGTVIARRAEPGQTLTATDVPIVLSDRLIVVGRVDETDIGSVHPGRKARITLDAYPDISLHGMVAHLAYEAQTVDNVITYEVNIELDEIPAMLRSGMTATVEILVEETEKVLTLPVDAVEEDDGQSYVLVAPNGTARPQRRPVETGLRARGRIEIRSGLDGEEPVVRRVFALPDAEDERGAPFLPRRR